VFVLVADGAAGARVPVAETVGATLAGTAVGVAGAEPGNTPHAQSTKSVAHMRVQRRT
jgi:hypothetical protein